MNIWPRRTKAIQRTSWKLVGSWGQLIQLSWIKSQRTVLVPVQTATCLLVVPRMVGKSGSIGCSNWKTGASRLNWGVGAGGKTVKTCKQKVLERLSTRHQTLELRTHLSHPVLDTKTSTSGPEWHARVRTLRISATPSISREAIAIVFTRFERFPRSHSCRMQPQLVKRNRPPGKKRRWSKSSRLPAVGSRYCVQSGQTVRCWRNSFRRCELNLRQAVAACSNSSIPISARRNEGA